MEEGHTMLKIKKGKNRLETRNTHRDLAQQTLLCASHGPRPRDSAVRWHGTVLCWRPEDTHTEGWGQLLEINTDLHEKKFEDEHQNIDSVYIWMLKLLILLA